MPDGTTAPVGVAPAPLTRRALQKQATARKVLDAARAEFAAGYEAATMRGIAARAGMSTGAVFANSADKAALYRAVYGHDPISPELGARMLQALELAETLYLNGLLATPNDQVARVHALRREVMAAARAPFA